MTQDMVFMSFFWPLPKPLSEREGLQNPIFALCLLQTKQD
jgi:hypothetical protein